MTALDWLCLTMTLLVYFTSVAISHGIGFAAGQREAQRRREQQDERRRTECKSTGAFGYVAHRTPHDHLRAELSGQHAQGPNRRG